MLHSPFKAVTHTHHESTTAGQPPPAAMTEDQLERIVDVCRERARTSKTCKHARAFQIVLDDMDYDKDGRISFGEYVRKLNQAEGV